ncbi:MAG: hypothetical protein JXK07_00470 [Spirochaetes bacterium]|nr:hypothetical protein [Spirochaetota bacterium]MBN2771502.1 hypothetical protein [Spirochaetota bacterium]
MFVPMASPAGEDEEMVPGSTTSWGWAPQRLGMTIAGNSDNVGFQADVNVDDGKNFGAHDQQFIWVKPMDGLRIAAGTTIFYDALRGNSAYGSWDWVRPVFITGEDNVFSRGVAGQNSNGAPVSTGNSGALISYDLGGVHVFAAMDVNAYNSLTVTEDNPETADVDETVIVEEQYTTAMMISRGQYGAGYDIAGVGQVRAQYIGKSYQDGDETKDWALINAAVKLDQLVPNLYVDLGTYFPTDDEQDKMSFAAYVRYVMGTMTINFSTDIKMDQMDAEGEEGMGMKFGVGFGMDLGGGLALDSDFRFANSAGAGAFADADGKAASAWSALLGLKKGFSNGLIGGGVQLSNADFSLYRQAGNGLNKKETDAMAWMIPVRVEYWF